MKPNAATELQKLVDKTAKKGDVPGVILGIRLPDSTDLLTFTSGYADADQTTPMTDKTPYFQASVTKMYTAAVTMRLLEQGSLELDASIGTYLSQDLIAGVHTVGGVDRTNEITIRQLLTQTSGLADYFEDSPASEPSLVEQLQLSNDRSISLVEILELVRNIEPLFPPGAESGKRAHYSDTNYALLGAIIEAITSEPLAGTFGKLIFDPLDLAGTYVFDGGTGRPAPAEFLYKHRPVRVPLAMASFVADGGIVATVADSLRFLSGFFGGELFSLASLDEMLQPWNRVMFPLRYGHGLMKFQLPRAMSPLSAPPELVGHSGSTGSFAFRDSESGTLLAGTVNQMDRPNRPYQLMLKALRSL